MVDNPSVIDIEKDKAYLSRLKENGLFVCGACFHEKPLKQKCAGKLQDICTTCFDELGKVAGIIKKACDQFCYEGK